MKMENLKKEWLQVLILAAPFCAAALLWDKIPERVPIHWNIHGQVDGYGGRFFGVILMPLTNVLLTLLMVFIPRIDPRMRKAEGEARASQERTVRIVRYVFSSFMSLFALGMLAAALGKFRDGVQFTYFVHFATSVLIIVLGNFMTKLRPNYLIGIRTPWTLASKEVWTRTHRLGGPLMVGGGFAMLVFCLMVPLEQFVLWVLLPVIGVVAVVPIGYSWWLHRKLGQPPASPAP